MTRTLNVKGYVREKGGKLHTVLEFVDGNGERQRRWKATGLTAKGNIKRAEAIMRERKQALIEELERKQRLPSEAELPFGDWARLWLKETRKRVDKNKLDIITYQGYEENASNHVIPYFDALGITVGEITLPILQAYIDEKAANGRKDGKGGLAPSSLRLHKILLRQVLDLAVRRKILVENPCKGLELPGSEPKEVCFYNKEQLERMFLALRDEPLYPLIRIAALYGLRRSELCGLRWDSVDFVNNSLTINHTVVHLKTVVAKNKTKSKSSRRTFPLIEDVRELLLELKEQEQENRRLFGKEYLDNPYIFKWPNGKPLDPDYVSRKFVKLIRAHELDAITLHGLRHSCASFLIAQGYNMKIVQDWLGHANISITADIYGHLDSSPKQGVANTIAGHFG